MRIDLSGKTALITGSTAGIGFAIAHGLANAGAEVVINGRTEKRVREAVERLRQELGESAKLRGVAADLADAAGAERLQAEVPEADILINNVGVFEPKPFFEIPDEDWERFFQINVMSGVRLSRYYAPKMVDRGWGRIIFISSESGLQIPTEMIHYGMTKTAQISIARGLAETLKASGVTVNSVLPGPTASEGVSQFVEDMARDQGVSTEEVEKEFFNNARPSSIIQRFAEVEEVANMVVFVASPQASAVTGASLRVDGGVVRSIA